MTDNSDAVRKRFENAEEVAPDPTLDDSPAPRTPPEDQGDAGQPPQTPENEAAEASPLRRASQQPLNDFGNGRRFAIHFGEDVMFVPRVGWFVWTGQVWSNDQDELLVRAKAQGVAALIEKEVDELEPTEREAELIGESFTLRQEQRELGREKSPTEEQIKRIGQIDARLRAIDVGLKDRKSLIGRRLTHAKNAGNNGPINHMLRESQTALAVAREALDASPLDVNCENGVLRFSVSEDDKGKKADFELLEHDRAQRLTKMAPVAYDPNARAPQFQAFLEQIQPDIEMRMFLQRWLGLSMSALKIQKFAFFYGSGANGKSVLVDTIARILDSYAASAKIESLTGSARRGGSEATPDLMLLVNARMVRTSEPDEGQRLQEGLIKELTGGEPMQVRALHSDFFEFDPHFKLTMSGNHKPEIRGTDAGIWRRVLLVPFDVQIPEEKRDQELGEKLWSERAGILNWLIEGLQDFLELGLKPPAGVTDATREYREESDPIGSFLVSHCEVTGNHEDKITARELGEAFNYALMERGMNTWKPTTFAKQVATKSRAWRHPGTGAQFEKGKSSISHYLGLRLEPEFAKRFRNAPRDHNNRIIGTSDGTPVATAPHPDVDD